MDKLKLLFDVFKRDERTFDEIVKKMQPFILECGMLIVDNEEHLKDPLLFTTKLLDLRQEFNNMIEFSFENKQIFQKSRDSAFTEFLNKQSCAPIFIAQFVDHLMKKGFKGVSDDEVEKKLAQIIELFQCLHARDSFMKSYEKDFATRLLNKTSLA